MPPVPAPCQAINDRVEALEDQLSGAGTRRMRRGPYPSPARFNAGAGRNKWPDMTGDLTVIDPATGMSGSALQPVNPGGSITAMPLKDLNPEVLNSPQRPVAAAGGIDPARVRFRPGIRHPASGTVSSSDRISVTVSRVITNRDTIAASHRVLGLADPPSDHEGQHTSVAPGSALRCQ